MSFQNAFLGSLVADAISMPVHWYYDVKALDRDYGAISSYLTPVNPHPDSILWRSIFNPPNPKSDILHAQKKYWGKKGIHYHQHLKAGGNTLNLQLSAELYRHVVLNGSFDIQNWLERYVEVMLTPNWHDDTYVEECHRRFFENYSRGKSLLSCGTNDFHIGALSLIPGLLAALEAIDQTEADYLMECSKVLVRSTHNDPRSLNAAADFTRILIEINLGLPIREAIRVHPPSATSIKDLDKWLSFSDRKVVGEILSRACYLPDSLRASIYIAWKYHDQFADGVLANAKAGGDNCHRGVVIGSILGIGNGVPEKFLEGLLIKDKLGCELSLSTTKNFKKEEADWTA